MLDNSLAPNTYVPPTPLDNLDVFVGDPKQKDFHPRVKLQKWNNEVNLSIGIKHSGGQHTVVGDKIHYKGGGLGATFYPVSASVVPSEKIRYISQGSIAPEYIAAQYELDRHIPQQDMLINSHFPQQGMMYYGYYRKAAYIKNKAVDMPEIRLAISGRENDPMYMDHGLPLIDVHYKETDNHDLIDSATKQAVQDTLKPYGVDISFDAGKGFFKHNGQQVKFFSAAFIGGHYYYYINLETDYNHAYDYFDEKPTIRNPYAYGVRTVNPNIPDNVVDKIVARFAQLYGLPMYVDSFSAREQKIIETLVPIHTDKAWIENADRGPFSSHASPQDGYEFEIILHRRPSTNIVPLSVKTKNLTFHYQPELSDKESLVKHRPPEVVGSYAAYHTDKMHNEYQAGKAFHIYRPWAVDSSGNKVWCDFDPTWDGVGDLEIIVPKTFLQNAIYPVVIDPTFGYTTMGSSLAAQGDIIQGLRNVTGVAGTITYLVAGLSQSGSASGKAAIYNTAAAKVAGSNEIVNIPVDGQNSGNWYPFTISGSTVSTTGYDLVFWGSNTSYCGIQFDTVTNAGDLALQTYASGNDGFPASASGFSANNDKYSIYATSDITIGNAFETVNALTENTKMTLVDNAKASDTVGSLTENVKMFLTMNINVSDSTTVSENVQTTHILNINVSDSTSTSENILMGGDEFLAVQDNTSTSESVQLNLPGYTFFVSTSDTVTSAEALSVTVDENINVTETITSSESINLFESIQFKVSDSVSTSESISVVLSDPQINVNDTTATSESVNLFETSFITTSDTISTSDTDVVVELEGLSVSDTVTTSESVNLVLTSFISTSDSTSATESVAAALSDPTITVSDTVTSSESVNAVISSFIAVSDTVITSELVNLVETSFISTSDTVVTSDTDIVVELEGLSVSDTINTAEAISILLTSLIE